MTDLRSQSLKYCKNLAVYCNVSFMSKGASLQLKQTKSIPNPNIYIQKMYGEYASFTYDEVSAPQWKGLWKKKVFNNPQGRLNLEIGTGTGFHIARQAVLHPHDSFIGIELKYKPLIQSIRRTVQSGSKNVRLIRYNACQMEDLFQAQELDNIYIHFPDPWPKRRQKKHRLITSSFVKKITLIQNKKGILELKTDCKEYFMKALSLFKKNTHYQQIHCSFDWHADSVSDKHIITTFESFFIHKNQPIYFSQWKHL